MVLTKCVHIQRRDTNTAPSWSRHGSQLLVQWMDRQQALLTNRHTNFSCNAVVLKILFDTSRGHKTSLVTSQWWLSTPVISKPTYNPSGPWSSWRKWMLKALRMPRVLLRFNLNWTQSVVTWERSFNWGTAQMRMACRCVCWGLSWLLTEGGGPASCKEFFAWNDNGEMWWCVPLIPALWGRGKDQAFKVVLGYTEIWLQWRWKMT